MWAITGELPKLFARASACVCMCVFVCHFDYQCLFYQISYHVWAFFNLLDPTYIIPNKKALGKMLDDWDQATKEQALSLVSKTSAVSLTAGM